MARTNYFHSLFVFLLRRLLYPSSSYYRHLFFIVIWTIPINQHGRLTRSYGLLRTGVVFPIYKVKTRLQSIPSTDGRGAFAQASEIIKKETIKQKKQYSCDTKEVCGKARKLTKCGCE